MPTSVARRTTYVASCSANGPPARKTRTTAAPTAARPIGMRRRAVVERPGRLSRAEIAGISTPVTMTMSAVERSAGRPRRSSIRVLLVRVVRLGGRVRGHQVRVRLDLDAVIGEEPERLPHPHAGPVRFHRPSVFAAHVPSPVVLEVVILFPEVLDAEVLLGDPSLPPPPRPVHQRVT